MFRMDFESYQPRLHFHYDMATLLGIGNEANSEKYGLGIIDESICLKVSLTWFNNVVLQVFSSKFQKKLVVF